MRIAVFCEAAADFATATGLVDRVLSEEGPDWVREHIQSRPLDDLRTWVGAAPRPFFDLHRLYQEASARKIPLPRNRFQGRTGCATRTTAGRATPSVSWPR